MTPRSEINHQNMLAEEWSRNCHFYSTIWCVIGLPQIISSPTDEKSSFLGLTAITPLEQPHHQQDHLLLSSQIAVGISA